MWIYRPTDEMIKKDFKKHNWYNTAIDEADCKKKIAELIKSGKYKKGELMYDCSLECLMLVHHPR